MQRSLANLSALLNAVTKVVTGCLRTTKVAIIVVLSYRESVKQNLWNIWDPVYVSLVGNITIRYLKYDLLIPGAYLLIMLELPNEEDLRIGKQNKTQDVDDSVEYLKSIFWIYANNQRFNFSKEAYKDQVKEARFR